MHTFLAEVAGRLKLFQTACNLCKTPFPSLLRRQEPSLKRSFSCRTGRRHPNKNNQIFDFIGSLLFSEICKTSKALLCTGHPPARVRQTRRSDSRIRPTAEIMHTFLAEVAGRLKFFQAACNLCKTPFPSLLRRQEPGLKRSLKRSFNCRTGRRHPNKNNQIFDFIGSLLFSEICKPSKALLCTGHPPARVRQIFGFAKVSACNLFLFSLKQTTLIFIQNAV